MPIYRNSSLEDRFWARVDRDPDGCWEWTGARWVEGYGRLSLGPGVGPKKAHRLSWELHYGAIPDGLDVLHRCDNPPCVRPDHLFVGTQADNMRDARAKHRWDKALRRQKIARYEHALAALRRNMGYP